MPLKGTSNRLQALALAGLVGLLLCSLLLSWRASQLSLVHLPAADVWQHTGLVAAASAGQLDLASLLERHNQLHFIPLPKLVYALDLLADGSGRLTASCSAFFTLLCCALFASLLAHGGHDRRQRETLALALLFASWLSCVLQWESFVNPANLQWSGLSAGLVLAGLGLQRRSVWAMAAGAGVAIGCGAPWWLLPLAALTVLLPPRRLLLALALLGGTATGWETLNGYWLQQAPPLALQAIRLALPLSAAEMAAISGTFFADPAGFYLAWGSNLLQFLASFCLPPLAQWLSAPALLALSPLPLLAALLLPGRAPAHRGLGFLLWATLLTGLAAGLVRAQLPGAYTGRFANTGLLFLAACAALAYPAGSCRKPFWWLLALLYSLVLGTSCWREAAHIVQDSNQRRLSQVAYALDMEDMRATSEVPFAPMMAQSYREISERKVVMQTHGKGIYGSREHRVYAGQAALPTAVVACQHWEIRIKPLKDDPAGRKITGDSHSTAGDSMTSVLLRNSAGQAIGYGIFQVGGTSLPSLLARPQRWAGFFHQPADGAVQVIAYNTQAQCEPLAIRSP